MDDRRPDPLVAVLPALRCPLCASPLSLTGTGLRCGTGHAFDRARQGYVSLAVGANVGTGDTAAMVQARADVLAGPLLRPVITALVRAVTTDLGGALPAGVVLDLAGGTGAYAAAVLDALPGRAGVLLDLSAPALRRAARAHPRLAALGADVWRPLPLGSATGAIVLSVFGPRDANEVRRVLAPGGAFVVVSPRHDHLAELVGPLGLIRVDDRKAARQAAAFADFESTAHTVVEAAGMLTRAAAAAVVAMGPSAAHLAAEEITRRVAGLPAAVAVTIAVDVRTYRPSPHPDGPR